MAKGQPRRVQATAPGAAAHAHGLQRLAAEPVAHPARFVAAFVTEVALRAAVSQPEARRVAGAGRDGVPHNPDMVATGEAPAAIVARKGLAAAPTDTAELETWCRDSIAANAKAVAEFKAGKESALNAFKGAIMKAAKGKANPKAVDETLRRLLAAL